MNHASERTAIVPDSAAGRRFDAVLAELFPEFSRSRLSEWIKSGDALLDGRAVRPRDPVRAGQAVSLAVVLDTQTEAVAEDIPLTVLHEDADVFVIDKPAGLVVHPGAGNPAGTLVNALLHRDPGLSVLPRAGIVHRLDKDTSGLMVVARTRSVMDALVQLIAARDVSRQYVALAHRSWGGAMMRHVDAPIGRDPRNRLRMAVVDLERHSGKPARTLIEALDSNDQGCTVRCTLETGRTHQIRVHMASIGHPLVGDTLYGGPAAAGLARQALHAFRLAFAHPVTGAPMEFLSGPPADLVQAMQAWGLDYNRA